MPAIARIVLHTIAAAVIFFSLQYFVLAASLQTSLLWSAVGAIGAAYLAWSQQNRSL